MSWTDTTGEAVFTGEYWIIDAGSVITKSFKLKNSIVSGSSTLYLNGLYVSIIDYTVQNQTLSFPSLPVVIGDKIEIEYLILG